MTNRKYRVTVDGEKYIKVDTYHKLEAGEIVEIETMALRVVRCDLWYGDWTWGYRSYCQVVESK